MSYSPKKLKRKKLHLDEEELLLRQNFSKNRLAAAHAIWEYVDSDIAIPKELKDSLHNILKVYLDSLPSPVHTDSFWKDRHIEVIHTLYSDPALMELAEQYNFEKILSDINSNKSIRSLAEYAVINTEPPAPADYSTEDLNKIINALTRISPSVVLKLESQEVITTLYRAIEVVADKHGIDEKTLGRRIKNINRRDKEKKFSSLKTLFDKI